MKTGSDETVITLMADQGPAHSTHIINIVILRFFPHISIKQEYLQGMFVAFDMD